MGVSASKTRASEVAHAAHRALWLALLLALPAGAQNGPPLAPGGTQDGPSGMQQRSPRQRLSSSLDQSVGLDSAQQAKWLRGLNIERQKSMVSDANKLLKLASELNAEVSSSNQDSLTLEQLRKVGEIEKLARSVKEKMSTSIQSTPIYVEPQVPQRR